MHDAGCIHGPLVHFQQNPPINSDVVDFSLVARTCCKTGLRPIEFGLGLASCDLGLDLVALVLVLIL